MGWNRFRVRWEERGTVCGMALNQCRCDGKDEEQVRGEIEGFGTGSG
jgi:hypothetical protein